MKTSDGVIEEMRLGGRYVVICDVDVPARMGMRRRAHELPSALIMIMVVVLLGTVVALAGLAVVSMGLPRVPVPTVTIDTEPAESRPIDTPDDVDETDPLEGPVMMP